MWLAILISLFQISSCQEPLIIGTSGYPNSWVGTLPKTRYTYNVSSGFGTSVLFREFLMSAGDCVIICDQTSDYCDSLCGDVMDHPQTKKILRVNSSALITMISNTASDNLVHSGISAKVVPVDLSNPHYFQCGSTVNLDQDSPFFLLSHNYPYAPADFTECHVDFESKDSIRLGFYDFVSNATFDYFFVSGDTYDQGFVNESYSGRHVTDDEPFGVYFKGRVSVSFKFDPTPYPKRGFYIMVDAFQYFAKPQHSCVNVGENSLNPITKFPIGTSNFGKGGSYQSNSDCPMKFTKSRNNSIILIDLEYETEKCCDTMDIKGISAWPFDEGTFQGSQGRFFYFAENSTVSMHFRSDGIVEGAGFNGAVYEIECVCSPSIIYLNDSLSFFTLQSPNLLQGAPSYCPSLSCSWTIDFPPDFDLSMSLPVVDLRTPNVAFDILTINDTFNRNLKSCIRTNTFPYSLTIPSGPTAVTFSSSSSLSFAPSLFGRGFQIDLLLTKKVLESKTIQFTDNYFMEDISTKRFAAGSNVTYEFKVQARSGRRVSIYFFSLIGQNAFVDIYDGASTDSSRINTNVLLTNIGENGHSYQMTSSGENVIIRVRANTDFGNTGQDFQAFVTDYQEEDGCGPLVYSMRKSKTIASIALSGADCIKVLHLTNSGYDLFQSMSLNFDKTAQIEIFKGITLNETHKMASSTRDPLPFEIFDRYVTLRYPAQTDTTVTFSWQVAGYSDPLTIEGDKIGVLMSADYLPYMGTSSDEQQFTIELTGSGTDLSGIRLEFLQGTGEGKGTFQMEKYNDVLWKNSYSGADEKMVLEECGTKLLITYEAPPGANNGLHAKYSKGSLSCKSASDVPIVFLSLFVCIQLIFRI